MVHKLTKTVLLLMSALQSTARLLGSKFLDHLIIGSAECEGTRGFISAVEGQ